MIYEINHFGVVVRDLAKSLEFYQDVLGGQVVGQGFLPASRSGMMMVQVSGGLIEILNRAVPAEDEEYGITHIAFMTNNLDADHAMLVKAGYKPLSEPKVAGSSIGRLAFFEDPNGTTVELIERDWNIRKPVIDHPIIKSFDHYSLLANDLAAAEEFYGNQLRMRKLAERKTGSGSTFAYFNYDYDVLQLVQRPQPVTEIYDHMAFRVDDLDKAIEYMKSKGYEPEHVGEKNSGAFGVGTGAIFRDPDGVAIELLDRPDIRDL